MLAKRPALHFMLPTLLWLALFCPFGLMTVFAAAVSPDAPAFAAVPGLLWLGLGAAPVYAFWGGSGLALDREGFVIRRFFRARRYQWADVTELWASRFTTRGPCVRVRLLAPAPFRFERLLTIWDIYEVRRSELAELMNRLRAGASGGGRF